MTVISVECVQPPPLFRIEVDQATAEMLCALLGGVKSRYRAEPLAKLFDYLDDFLPHREKGFSAYFKGDVEYK